MFSRYLVAFIGFLFKILKKQKKLDNDQDFWEVTNSSCTTVGLEPLDYLLLHFHSFLTISAASEQTVCLGGPCPPIQGLSVVEKRVFQMTKDRL